MKLILDTSIVIDNFRGGNVWNNIIDNIESANVELFVPTVVIFEFFSGKSTSRQEVVDQANIFLNKFERIDLNEKIAKRAGKLFREIGSHIGPVDYIIAASALEIGGEVLTLNTRHFEKIPGLKVYTM